MDRGATEVSNLRDVRTAGGKYGLAHTKPSHEGGFPEMARRDTGPPIPSRNNARPVGTRAQAHKLRKVEKKRKATMETWTSRLGNG